jgi:hypothetical protein
MLTEEERREYANFVEAMDVIALLRITMRQRFGDLDIMPFVP